MEGRPYGPWRGRDHPPVHHRKGAQSRARIERVHEKDRDLVLVHMAPDLRFQFAVPARGNVLVTLIASGKLHVDSFTLRICYNELTYIVKTPRIVDKQDSVNIGMLGDMVR